MPGTMFSSTKQSTISFPSVVDWYNVSSKRIAPEMYSPSPGVVHNSCLYACRFTSLFSSPIDDNRKPQVALDSSIAKIPRPGVAMVFCAHHRTPILKIHNPTYRSHINGIRTCHSHILDKPADVNTDRTPCPPSLNNPAYTQKHSLSPHPTLTPNTKASSQHQQPPPNMHSPRS